MIISPDAAGPPDQGFRIRVHHLAIGLAAAMFDVTLVAGPTPPGGADALRGFGVEVIASDDVGQRTDRPRNAVLRGLSLLTGQSKHDLGDSAGRLLPIATALLQERRFDAVQVEVPDLVELVGSFGVPVVYDAHNVWAELRARRDRLFRSRLRRAIGWIARHRRTSMEIRAWRGADLCLATSPREASTMEAAGARSVAVIRNGVDLSARAPWHATDDDTPRARGLVFVGLLAYRPNADAVTVLLRDILPVLRTTEPNVSVTIVGAGASDELLRMAGPLVTFTGRVDDPRPYIAAADVVVVPLRIGSGTRLKILEALAVGRPVVTTTIGAEGLDLVAGEHALIADDPRLFAAAIARILGDAALAESLSRRGRHLVERTYGWATITDELVAAYDRLLGTP